MKDENMREEKLVGGEIVVKNRFVDWISNVWYHHKWKIIVILFFTVVLGVCLLQCTAKESTDLGIGFSGNYVMTKEQQSVLRRTVSGILPKDYDGNGTEAAALYTYSIFTDEELKSNCTSNGTLDSYSYQSAKATNLDEYRNMRTFLQTGECSVWFVSPNVYRDTGLNIAHFCRPLSELYTEMPQGAVDAYAVRLGDTAFYRHYTALQFLPADTLILLFQPLQWGASGDAEIYARSVETFRAILAFDPAAQ